MRDSIHVFMNTPVNGKNFQTEERRNYYFHLDHGSAMRKKIVPFYFFFPGGAENLNSLTHFRQGLRVSYIPRSGDKMTL